jgi:hypothetical protein
MSRSLMPLEAEASEGIQQEFADDFQLAESTLSLALNVVGSTPMGPGAFEVQKPRGLTWKTVHLAFGLYAKICKQQRSIIALCELGLWQDAACIERSMFEAVLALNFLLRPRIKLTENGKLLGALKQPAGKPCPKCTWAPPAPPHTELKPLTTKMRRQLYLAGVAAERKKRLCFEVDHGDSSVAKAGDLADAARTLARVRKTIGRGWVERQRKSRQYSGVRIADLARSYKLGFYYEVVYRLQSRHVHATDACDFVDTSSANPSDFLLDLGPNPTGVSTMLFFGTVLLAGAADVLDNRIGMGFRQQIQATMLELRKRGEMTQQTV